MFSFKRRKTRAAATAAAGSGSDGSSSSSEDEAEGGDAAADGGGAGGGAEENEAAAAWALWEAAGGKMGSQDKGSDFDAGGRAHAWDLAEQLGTLIVGECMAGFGVSIVE